MQQTTRRYIILAAGLAALSTLAGLSGCSKDPPRPEAPRPRIVSFSPALTQIVYDLGLGAHVVGVTTQCALPEQEGILRVGDAQRVDSELILSAAPDVLLIQSRPEEFATVHRLDPKVRIEHFKIETVDDIRSAITRIGDLAHRPDLAQKALTQFNARLDTVKNAVRDRGRPRVLFVLGYENPSVAGAGTFIGDMIRMCGGINAGDPAAPHQRWRNISLEEIILAAPDVILCQVAPGEEERAKAYWSARTDIPAGRYGRVYPLTDARWTIPSTRLPVLAEAMARMIYAAPEDPAP